MCKNNANFIAQSKSRAYLLSSDFPAENPLTQTRTILTPTVVVHYGKRKNQHKEKR